MIQVASYTNIGGRSENEDTVSKVRDPDGNLCLVVADGLGGHGGGKIASGIAADVITAGWTGGAGEAQLEELVKKAHAAVKARQTPACEMKSTVVALSLFEKQAAWVHVGDSRLYHFYQGTLDYQTKDHSASQVAVMLGEITPDQIRFHEARSRVLKALGQSDDRLIPTADGMELAPGRHAFLLCTDGFWEYVLEEEMEEDLRMSHDPYDWIGRMRDRHFARIPADNDNNSAAAVWVEA